MKGKLRKIALGMSVLMCAGMLFTCVMPAKAAIKLCDHSITHALLGFSDWKVVGFDDQGHYMERDELAGCGICGETFSLNTESKKEPHDFVTTIYWSDHTGTNSCTQCNYEEDFIIIPVN